MNWYLKQTTSQSHYNQLNDFDDRNAVNQKIRNLKELSSKIRSASKIAYQTQRNTKIMLSKVKSNKILSSYPSVLELLENAIKVSLDSPKATQFYADAAADEIDVRIYSLERARSDFTQNKSPNMLWFGNKI